MRIPRVTHIKVRLWRDPRDWTLKIVWKYTYYIHILFVSFNFDWSRD